MTDAIFNINSIANKHMKSLLVINSMQYLVQYFNKRENIFIKLLRQLNMKI